MQHTDPSIPTVPFSFEGNTVRTVAIGGGVWFVAQDVLKALGYSEYHRPSQAIRRIPAEWRSLNPTHTPGGEQLASIISEQGLCFFLGGSGKPKVAPFLKWLANEVLPSIRKNGYPRDKDSSTISIIPDGRPGFKIVFS